MPVFGTCLAIVQSACFAMALPGCLAGVRLSALQGVVIQKAYWSGRLANVPQADHRIVTATQ